MALSCFKTYDIRGRLDTEINNNIAYNIGRAFAIVIKAKNVVIGGDARATSPSLKHALSNGLRDEGVNVIDLGLAGTEEIYFATSALNMGGGIVVTASHNPIDYNGMKLVSANSVPVSRTNGLNEIERIAEAKPWLYSKVAQHNHRGTYRQHNLLPDYVNHLISYISPIEIRPTRLVVNAGNGAAGHVIDEIEQQFNTLNIPVEFIKIHHQPDANFPNGIPNPLLVENRRVTCEAVIANNADMGIAWDGDFDRCFLFDETGAFIEGYYIVGLLAQAFLQQHKNAKIIHDPRLTWNTIDIINQTGGEAIQSQTGHVFIKERMRLENAVYGGEMSAHHYFRDFNYCDSGMIPWLLVMQLLSTKNMTLSQAVNERVNAYPSSGEINFKIKNPDHAINRIFDHFQASACNVDRTDGISLEFSSEIGQWRFNLRISNTEDLVRLNVETKGNKLLMKQKAQEILSLLEQH